MTAIQYHGPAYAPAAREDRRTTRWQGHVAPKPRPDTREFHLGATVRFTAWARGVFQVSERARGVVREIDHVERRISVERPFGSSWWTYDFWEEVTHG